jgi:hypothetical protein
VGGAISVGQLPLMVGTNAVFRLNFVDPDNEDGLLPNLPQTSALYWYEGESNPPDGVNSKFSMAYSMVTGMSNYTSPKYAAVTSGAAAQWTPGYTNGNFAGDFDIGSFYVTASPNGYATYNYFLQWTETHAQNPAPPNGFIHYNVAQAVDPVFSDPTQVSSSMAMTTDPAAAKMVTSGGVRQIHVIAADSSSVVKRIIYSDNTGTWGSWNTVGNFGTTVKPAAAVSWGPGRLDIFGIGINDKLMYHYPEQDGVQLIGGSGWESLGGPAGGFSQGPSVASLSSGTLFIVGVDQGGVPNYKTWKNGWSAWTPIGGVLRGAPATVALATNRVDVFGRGTDDRLYQYTAFSDGTSNWESKGWWYGVWGYGPTQFMTGSVSAAVHFGDRVDVFAGDGMHPFLTGPSDTVGRPQVMHAWHDAGWSNWHTIGTLLQPDVGTTTVTSVAAVVLGSTRTRLITRGVDNRLWWQVRNACAHDVCQSGAALSAQCDPCVATVCASDAHCCSTTWDTASIDEATSWCTYSCP